MENRKGRLASVTGLLAEKHINLRALSIADTTSFGILRLIADKPEEVAAILAENNVTAAGDIREFRELGYRYNAGCSGENHYVFIKEVG